MADMTEALLARFYREYGSDILCGLMIVSTALLSIIQAF